MKLKKEMSLEASDFRLAELRSNQLGQMRNPWVLSIMPKITEISVGIQIERSVSVSSERNIRDHLWRWSTYFGWNIPIEIRHSILTNRFFALIREFGNDKKWQELSLLVGAV